MEPWLTFFAKLTFFVILYIFGIVGSTGITINKLLIF